MSNRHINKWLSALKRAFKSVSVLAVCTTQLCLALLALRKAIPPHILISLILILMAIFERLIVLGHLDGLFA